MGKRNRTMHGHRKAPKQNGKAVTAVQRGPETEPDWTGECEVCGASPIVPLTGMCGPCTFGEADTVGGNW